MWEHPSSRSPDSCADRTYESFMHILSGCFWQIHEHTVGSEQAVCVFVMFEGWMDTDLLLLFTHLIEMSVWGWTDVVCVLSGWVRCLFYTGRWGEQTRNVWIKLYTLHRWKRQCSELHLSFRFNTSHRTNRCHSVTSYQSTSSSQHRVCLFIGVTNAFYSPESLAKS